MWLVIGLGNPGQRYHLTRHNVGFMVIDLLAKQHRIQVTRHKEQAVFGRGRIGNESVILAKPLTYMNRSGIAVRNLIAWFKLQATDLIVISDDFHLPVGALRIRRQGSSGGHHGLESIIENLGTAQFTRIKVGIGEPEEQDVVDYVLTEFTKVEINSIDESTEKAAQAVTTIIEQSINKAMNKFN
ncbi:MAG: aminoacyl-tRNA hydrolase [bacterium]|nr:aminoacyl-tRNA hydrolase [bacterium]